jgi:hypothetical protein
MISLSKTTVARYVSHSCVVSMLAMTLQNTASAALPKLQSASVDELLAVLPKGEKRGSDFAAQQYAKAAAANPNRQAETKPIVTAYIGCVGPVIDRAGENAIHEAAVKTTPKDRFMLIRIYRSGKTSADAQMLGKLTTAESGLLSRWAALLESEISSAGSSSSVQNAMRDCSLKKRDAYDAAKLNY